MIILKINAHFRKMENKSWHEESEYIMIDKLEKKRYTEGLKRRALFEKKASMGNFPTWDHPCRRIQKMKKLSSKPKANTKLIFF